MLTAVLFSSIERFISFKKIIEDYGIKCIVMNFSSQEWLEYDYTGVDFVVYYPSFKYTSNHPLSLHEVHDNLVHIKSMYPTLHMYPDPASSNIITTSTNNIVFEKSPLSNTLNLSLFSEESITWQIKN